MRPSRPFQDDDWTEQDHYYDGDLPEESCSEKWNRVYHDLDEIQVNGAIRRHWSKGKEEVRQVVARTRKVLGNERPCRSDLTKHFYGRFSPLFGVCHRSRWLELPEVPAVFSISMRLSTNN